ncbi:MAG: hypothetical protein KC441_09570 [Anaerolineales bacterium]|nr:hypothetical protein [Anaerolineales bacterium]
MNRRNWMIVLTAVCLVCLVMGGLVLAQSGGSFALRQYTIDGGGGSSAGSAFVVRGTAGQADAGTASGGTFQINGGFWHSRGPETIYLPFVLR